MDILVCKHCYTECRGKGVDLSFSHAFGTHVDGFYGSDCCEESLCWLYEDDYSILQQLKEDAPLEVLDKFLQERGQEEDGSDAWSD